MTEISLDDVRHLARLSNLQIDDAEAESLQGDLENIIGYIKQLGDLNTEGVEPTYQVTNLSNVWREDEVDNYGVGREELLELAPESKNNQIKVPKVL